MRILLNILAVLLICIAVINISSATDVRVLSDSELSSYVGGTSCCKGSAMSGEDCQKCHPNGEGKSKKFNTGTGGRKCKTGTPDGCQDNVDDVNCGEGAWWFYNNDACDGQYASYEMGSHSVKTARGNECN